MIGLVHPNWLESTWHEVYGGLLVIGLTALITAAFIRPLKRALLWIDKKRDEDRRANLVAAVDAVLAPKLAAIQHQFSPNNGSSLIDKVNRIEEKVSEVASKLDAHLGQPEE